MIDMGVLLAGVITRGDRITRDVCFGAGASQQPFLTTPQRA